MKRTLPLLLVTIIALFFFPVSKSYAQDMGTRMLVIGGTSDEAGNLSINFSGEPGETLTGTTVVTNLGTDTIKVTPEFVDYIVESEAGIPTPVEPGSSIWAMSLWMSVSEDFREFTLEPNEAKEVPFTVDIPLDVTPGGHYAMILFTPAIVQEEVAGPLVEQKVGNLVKLTVAGDVKEDAEITEFSSPYFSEFGPIPLNLRVLNSGNTHVKTSGKITIKNMLDKQVAEWELKPANVFPTAVRAWDTEWAGKWRFGLYKAEANLIFGSGDEKLYTYVYFWVIPWKLLVVVAGVILGLLTLGKYQNNKDKFVSSKNEEATTSV